jgi:hypothetical protein
MTERKAANVSGKTLGDQFAKVSFSLGDRFFAETTLGAHSERTSVYKGGFHLFWIAKVSSMTNRVRELHDLAKLQLAKGGKDAVKAALRSILYTITSDRKSELQNASLSCDADNAWALEYPKHYTNLMIILRWVGETVVDPEEYLNLVARRHFSSATKRNG